MVWKKKKPIKEWTFDTKREPCDCSQTAPLRISGYSEKQGPTHFCPICRWGFWPVLIKPSKEQVVLFQISYPEANEKNMSYMKMCNKPAQGQYGKSTDDIMLDQMGKLMPDFLTEGLKEYWIEKYCAKYPNGNICINRAKRKEEEKQRGWK